MPELCFARKPAGRGDQGLLLRNGMAKGDQRAQLLIDQGGDLFPE
jgi:hypothetical protein